MGKLIAAAGVAVGVWLGLAVSIDSAFGADEVEHTNEHTNVLATDASQDLAELRTALSALDQVMQSSEAPVELTMGWADLRNDTLSMSKDLLRDPTAVNAEGMLNRIRSFWESYTTTSDLGPWLPEWGQFQESFRDLVSETGASVSGPSRLHSETGSVSQGS